MKAIALLEIFHTVLGTCITSVAAVWLYAALKYVIICKQ